MLNQHCGILSMLEESCVMSVLGLKSAFPKGFNLETFELKTFNEFLVLGRFKRKQIEVTDHRLFQKERANQRIGVRVCAAV